MGGTRFVADNAGIALPDDFSVTGNAGIGPTDGGFAIEVELLISLLGMEMDQAGQLIEQSHQVCPYSNATRGNIDVCLTLAN